MTPILENLIVSLITGAIAGATIILQPDASRDWLVIGATAVIAFGGAFINGLRQLQKDPPK